jgi:predicted alpha/beta superfamily hydrolase
LSALAVLATLAACGEQGLPPDAGSGKRADAGIDPVEHCGLVSPFGSDLENYDALVECLRSEAEESVMRDAVATFVALAESREGFPLVGAERVVFVYVRSAQYDREDDARPEEDFNPGRRREPVRVAGDFNNWDGAAAELQRESGDFFHRSFKMIVAADDRWRYKLVAKDSTGEDVWFSDPLSRRFDFDENGRISIVRGGDAQGHLETVREVVSQSLGIARDVYLYLPRGYDFGTDRYPVLYMHDGNNLFDTGQPNSAPGTWDVDAVSEAETGAGRVREHLIVGIPNNANRMGEYTHVKESIDGQALGGDGDKYARFVVQELKPLVDARYRTRREREHTAILGSSLGGLISFYIGLKHPEVFKYVGGMSSSFWWGSELGNPTMTDLYAGAADLSTRGQVFYLDSGGGPPLDGCSMEARREGSDNYCDTLRMKAALEAKGIDTYPDDPNAPLLQPENIDIFHWHEPGAEHNEAAWNARMFRPLRLFFRP